MLSCAPPLFQATVSRQDVDKVDIIEIIGALAAG
jgi:hypothetical protein